MQASSPASSRSSSLKLLAAAFRARGAACATTILCLPHLSRLLRRAVLICELQVVERAYSSAKGLSTSHSRQAFASYLDAKPATAHALPALKALLGSCSFGAAKQVVLKRLELSACQPQSEAAAFRSILGTAEPYGSNAALCSRQLDKRAREDSRLREAPLLLRQGVGCLDSFTADLEKKRVLGRVPQK